jgi:putative ABC transport system permease protein
MKFTLSLAWKNLFRYTRRTVITSVAIAIGIAVYIWVDGWMLGIQQESDRNFIWYETGSAAVFDGRFWADRDFMPLKYGIKDPQAIVDELAANGIPATPRLRFQAELFHNDVSFQVITEGIDPATDEAVFRILKNKTLTKGSYLSQSGEEILLGSTLAENLAVTVGDTVELRTRTQYGTYNTVTLKVTGIIGSPNPAVDKATGLIPLSTAQALLDMDRAVTQVAVSYPELSNMGAEMGKTAALLAPRFPGLTVKDFTTISGNPNTIDTKKSFIGILLFLVFIIAAVGVTNTMLMSVYERIRESGMMRALGMEDRSIRWLFLLEASGIGIIGSAVGIGIGALLTWYTVTWGFDFGAYLKNVDIGMRIGSVFRGAWNPGTMVTGFLFGVIVSGICAWIPSSKALNLGVTDCLRYQ